MILSQLVSRRFGVAAFALLVGLVLAPEVATAQERRDTTAVDTTAADTTPAAPRVAADPAADSILRLLRELQGYTVTEYQGNTAVYRADEGVLRLRGQAQVNREGSKLTADTIIFRDRTDLVEAYGSPSVTGQAQELEGDVLYYDLARRRATALGARTTVTEGATWLVRGDVTLEGTDRVYATHGTFTTCDLEIPHYHFESDKILVIRDRLLVARPARLYFGEVPVMVLPFIVQNLERGRRSGLLIPTFGINDIVRTSSGYTRQISDLGWYWAINDYIGAQLSGTWRSGAYTALLGNVDYRWRRQFLEGNLSYQQFWRDGGQRELNFRGNSNWQPDERTRLGFTGSYASSSEFIRDASFDPREVTQDLTSTLSLTRRFDWGNLALGADRRQSVADGSVSATLPSFGITPKSITLFRSPTPEQASWFSNATLTLGATGRRQYTDGKANFERRIQDDQRTLLQANQSLSVGNFSWSTSGNLNRTLLERIPEADNIAGIPEARDEQAGWQSNLSYRQELIGTTSISPTLAFSQDIRRSERTGEEYLAGPTRMSFGAGLNTDLYGFFPGIGGYSAIRHRASPRLNFSYAPALEQSALQDSVFGKAAGRAQNVISLSLNQTFEAKLRNPTVQPRDTAPADTLGGDTVGAAARREAEPAEPQKVTILSIDTSPLRYDFVQAAEEGNGWVTDRISNSITSDYLKGLRIQVEHQLFDRSQEPDPNALGRFAPRLSQLNTGFELGPGSAVFRWLGLGQDADNPTTQGVFPGAPPPEAAALPGSGAATGNPRATGGGDWRLGLQYSFTRSGTRSFSSVPGRIDEAIQTVSANTSFPLTPNLAVNWTTDYSITDGKFGAHRLNFKRNLHRWQANFDFYQTPNGNSAFQFYVELIDNPDLKFDYREDNLGIDERGRRRR